MKKLSILLLCVASFPTFAERLFDVEVIVFKRNQNPDTVGENWPDNPAAVNFNHAVSISDSETLKQRGLTLLPSSEWQLTEAYNKLSAHAGFKPLMHAAWRQGDGGRNAMPKLRLIAGRNFDHDFFKDGAPKTQPAPFKAESPQDAEDVGTLDSSLSLDTQHPTGPVFELDGSLRVYVQHYLFVETDLRLRQPGERKVLESNVVEMPLEMADSGADVQFGGLQEIEKTYHIEKYLRPYAFKQKRRMRSGETHYLDHPLMGMIIQVRKVPEAS